MDPVLAYQTQYEMELDMYGIQHEKEDCKQKGNTQCEYLFAKKPIETCIPVFLSKIVIRQVQVYYFSPFHNPQIHIYKYVKFLLGSLNFLLIDLFFLFMKCSERKNYIIQYLACFRYARASKILFQLAFISSFPVMEFIVHNFFEKLIINNSRTIQNI